MDKIVISKKRKKSGTKSSKEHAPFTSKELKDAKLVVDTLIDPKKGFNPELSIISSIIQSLAA